MCSITGPLVDAGGLDELAALWSQLHRHHWEVATHRGLVTDVNSSWRDRRRWYVSLLAEGGAYFTARTGETLVGYLMASVSPGEDDTFAVRGGIVEVVSLVVAKEARGGGIGRRLMGSAEEFTRQLGFHAMRVAVMLGNDTAAAFYDSLGFQPAEQVFLRVFD